MTDGNRCNKRPNASMTNKTEILINMSRKIAFFPSCLRVAALLVLLCVSARSWAEGQQDSAPSFRVVAIAEKGGIHLPFVQAAKAWLNDLAAKDGFAIDYIEDTTPIDDAFLAKYQLFIQLNYPPYAWTPTAQAAFINYIEQGKGGWIGFHHATLLGEFDGYQMWPWFSQFMGGIRFTAYIPTFADGTVTVEDTSHTTMKGVSRQFVIEKEEWYTWDKSPRPNVHVLASVDEKSYNPNSKTKMGDHPIIWTNEHYKARNIYIFMGHHPELFQNPAFTTIFRNSIFWAAYKEPS
jgi:type 1 glutamine amidotransferase